MDTGARHDTLPRVGVSACLIGWEVRYAGGHKWNALIDDEMGPGVEWIPVCPELEIGLGMPREAIELVGDPENPELVGTESGRRLAATMHAWSARRLEELAAHDLCGYVLKAWSPSCGPRNVPVYSSEKSASEVNGPAGANPVPTGIGLFARALLLRFPGMPIVDETELTSREAVSNFVARVYDYRLSSRRR